MILTWAWLDTEEICIRVPVGWLFEAIQLLSTFENVPLLVTVLSGKRFVGVPSTCLYLTLFLFSSHIEMKRLEWLAVPAVPLLTQNLLGHLPWCCRRGLYPHRKRTSKTCISHELLRKCHPLVNWYWLGAVSVNYSASTGLYSSDPRPPTSLLSFLSS